MAKMKELLEVFIERTMEEVGCDWYEAMHLIMDKGYKPMGYRDILGGNDDSV